MESVLFAVRVALAGVFLLAGGAKLADLKAARQVVANFGAPPALAPALGLLLPVAELGVGLALLTPALAWGGALAAVTLALLFIGASVYNLAHGRRPDCGCFGPLHSAPVGRPLLMRNAGLALLAALVVWRGRAGAGPSLFAPILALGARAIVLLGHDRLAPLALVALALLAAESALLVLLLRQHARLLAQVARGEPVASTTGTSGGTRPPASAARPGGRPVGSEAPAFALTTLDAERVSLDALRARRLPVLLVFVDAGCGACSALWPEIARWQREHASALTLAVISSGAAEANHTRAAAHGVATVLLQQDGEVAAAYGVSGTPAAVLVHPDGTIGSPASGGAEAIRALVAQATGRLPVLQPAPAMGHGNGHAATRPWR